METDNSVPADKYWDEARLLNTERTASDCTLTDINKLLYLAKPTRELDETKKDINVSLKQNNLFNY